jgi:hypothetical protein
LGRATPVLQIGKDTHGANRKSFWFSLSVDYTSTPKVTKYGCDLDNPNDWCDGKAGSLSELDTSTSSAYCDAETKKLYLKIVSTGYEWEELEI